jgi:hypothetical protein
MRGNPGTVGMVAWVISMLMFNAPGAAELPWLIVLTPYVVQLVI